MRPLVLCDRHHAGLLYSLQALFEDRFDMEVFVPVGHEWWDEGYWRFGEVWGDDRLAQQFLVRDARWEDARGTSIADAVTWDPDFPGRPIGGVTLDTFRQHEWRFVVASVQDNQQGFARLAKEVGATFVYQVGNVGQYVDWTLDQRLLVSSSLQWPDGARAVRYHQELGPSFRFAPALASEANLERPVVRSFVSLLNRMPAEWERFTAAEKLLPDFRFFEHGHESRDGFVQPQSIVAALMAQASFGWHDKPTGDGFGHVIHGWAAMGRPLIARMGPYEGTLAGPLLEDGVTCFDLDRWPLEEIVSFMRNAAAKPERWLGMCLEIRRRFDELVNYDAEAAAIAELLEINLSTT